MTSVRHHNGRHWQAPSTVGTLLDVIVEPALGRVMLYGELDLGSCQLLANVLDAATAFPGDITVDMAAVSFIDATGIGALVGCRNDLTARGDALRIANPPPAPDGSSTCAGSARCCPQPRCHPKRSLQLGELTFRAWRSGRRRPPCQA